MTTIDSRLAAQVRTSVDAYRTPTASANHVGWVAALVWPAVWTAVVAGSLLGAEGRILLWIGIAGVAAMLVRQGMKLLARNVRAANSIIDNAPGSRAERDALAVRGTARWGE
ncbi:hypothetical protein [Frondihabitans australicus]|nr:hypothetical protein [Frondihabitans australicus]